MAPAPSASSQHPLDGSQDPCCRPELEEGRKGRDRQEGRCLHPFPQKHVLHREKQCHTGPAAGGEGEGRALDMGLAKLLPGGRRPLVLLRPDFLCDLSSVAAPPCSSSDISAAYALSKTQVCSGPCRPQLGHVPAV